MSEPDHVDVLIEQWARERPDLELAPMATIGRLGRLNALAGRSIEAVFAEHGLTVGEFDVLAALRRAGEPFAAKPIDLARMMMLTPAGMTNRVDRLEAAGLVERESDPTDRRVSRVVLTAAGRALVDEAVTDHVANEARLLEPLTAAERRALDTILRKLLAQFDES
jgi:DNA-binding MarR family transcriptional regulator